MSDTTTRPTYKQTLNLPRTAFPMKANLHQNEPQSQKRWDEMGLYARVQEARTGAPPFVFHDGPPYANAALHVGHLLNKVLKDLVVRTRTMMGQSCPYIPGWDCHGLPIEHRVMTDLVESGKIEKLNSLGEDDRRMAVRRECQRHAEKSIKLQSSQMQRLLTLADYDDPYITMLPRYEQAVLKVFADLVDRGLVYRALKSVHWSIANQTALAEAELEYQEREDISVYVDFEAEDRGAVARAFGVELDTTPSFMIWTTTPWTLPANLAIAVNERFRYALVEVDGNVTIIAADLVQKVTGGARAESIRHLGETEGRNLVGLRYRHPFVDVLGGGGVAPQLSAFRDRNLQSTEDLRSVFSIVAADYVTLEDGTGLVHTAPGHGEDDYQTGLREELPIYCPVRGDGTFDETTPRWLLDVNIWDANGRIVEHLRESGHLFFDHPFTHSYPHDWRSKTPVIFRATEQWFVAVNEAFSAPSSDPDDTLTPALTRREREAESLRDRALDACQNTIRFIPEWGRNRMRGMLESRPDWCLSRQRSWGLPIPAFTNQDGEVFLTAESVRAVAKVISEKGSDAWFTEDVNTLLQYYDPNDDPALGQSDLSRSEKSFDLTKLQKAYDIFDVWFESGSSWNAVLRQRNLGYPADLYLEGSDQHRGWFQLSLLPALGVTGQSPFKALLTHGFMVDKDGRKMSKSGGNALNVEELLKDFGADVCRWWVSSLAFESDIKVDIEFFKLAGESYRKVRNTLRFLLGNLADFEPRTAEHPDGMCVDLDTLPAESLDAYVLNRAKELQTKVCAAYEAYEFRKANQMLYDFCNDTLSAFYCAAVKDRLYCDAGASPRRRSAQTVLWDLVEVLARLLAPIVPHTADEAYRALWNDESRCVHLEQVGEIDVVAANPHWPMVIAARERVLKALEDAKANGIENPLDAEVVLSDTEGVLKTFAVDLPDLFGVSRVSLKDGREDHAVMINDLRSDPRCDRCWKRTEDTRDRSDGGTLCERCAQAVGTS